MPAKIFMPSFQKLFEGFMNKKKPDSLKVLHGTFRPDRKSTPASPGGISPNPPRGLTKEGRDLWRMVCGGWCMDPAGLVVLRQVCECLGRLREAQGILEAEGLTVFNEKTGMTLAHPMLKVEKDTREIFVKFWRLLALDIEAPPAGGK
jgi:P27 family predicted phage terminase small subunit